MKHMDEYLAAQANYRQSMREAQESMEKVTAMLHRQAQVIHSVAQKAIGKHRRCNARDMGRFAWTKDEWQVVSMNSEEITIHGICMTYGGWFYRDIAVPVSFLTRSDRALAAMVREEIYENQKAELERARESNERRLRHMELEVVAAQRRSVQLAEERNTLESFIGNRKPCPEMASMGHWKVVI